MRKRYILFLLLLVSVSAFSQGRKPNVLEKLYFGGGIGFLTGQDGNGNRYVYFALNPIIGYRVTDVFSVGTGITYQSYRYTDLHISIKQYGISPFARYNFSENLFGYGEYNTLSSPTLYNTSRQTYSRLLLGGGYYMPFSSSGRGAMNIMLLYDVLYDAQKGIYASPWVTRIFFTF